MSLPPAWTLAIPGVRSWSSTYRVTGIPLLRQIPVFGHLSGGHANSDTELEGAVFVIPSEPRIAHVTVRDSLASYARYAGAIDEARSFADPPPDYR